MSDSDKLDALRTKWAKHQETRDMARLRATQGPRLAAAASAALGRPIAIEDFDANRQPPTTLDWPRDIAEAPGLVKAYADRQHASALLACLQSKLDAPGGWIGFHDKPYVGWARIDHMRFDAFLHLAEAEEESVILHIDHPVGVILVDCYPTSATPPFSIVVQGDALVSVLAPCFQESIP